MQNNIPYIVVISALLFLNSCVFNGSFYHPDAELISVPRNVESIKIPYANNDSVHVLFYKHMEPKSSIFILHGNAGSLNGWQDVAQIFHRDNHQVFIIDYPGFGESQGKAIATNIELAAEAAVKYFLKMPQVEATKKVIMGFSLGGNLAVQVGVNHQESFDLMVLEGAFTNHKAIAIERTPRPLKIAPRLLVRSPIKANKLIESWEKPLFVIHSSEDRICPYKMGEEIYTNSPATNKEFWTIKGPHLAGLNLQPTIYLRKIENKINS